MSQREALTATVAAFVAAAQRSMPTPRAGEQPLSGLAERGLELLVAVGALVTGALSAQRAPRRSEGAPAGFARLLTEAGARMDAARIRELIEVCSARGQLAEVLTELMVTFAELESQ